MSQRYLTAVEEHGLIVRAQAGDLAARDRVIANIMPMVHREANRIANRTNPGDSDDLAQAGALLIVQRFDTFKPELGYRFATYFFRSVQRIMLVASKQNGVIRCKSPPSALKEKTRAARLKHAGPLASLNEPQPAGACLLDLLLETRVPDCDDARADLAQAVRSCVARLPARHRRIVEAKLAGHSLREIGADCGGITHERARQLLLIAMDMLKQVLLSSPIVREFVEEHGGPVDALEPVKRKPRRRGAA